MHGCGVIDQDAASEVGFFLVLLGVESVRPGKDLPVNVSGAFTKIVKLVLSKLDRKAMIRRLMQAGDEAIHQLLGNESQVVVLIDFGNVCRHNQIFTSYSGALFCR